MAERTRRQGQHAGGDPSAPPVQVLPDFCSTETVLRVFVIVGLLALAAVLLRGADDPLIALAPVLMFSFWVSFSSLLFLCLTQRWLRRLRLSWQVAIPTLIPVLNTALVQLGAERFFYAESEHRVRVIAIAALLSLIAMRYFYLLAAWQQETRLVAQAREQALRARVRPHFLFNSMNTIAGLCRTDPARAEQVTLDLADLFRATFATEATHTLAEELQLVRQYLDIEQTRFGDRLQLQWDTQAAEGLDLHVPSLVLQPLIENAIQHGVAPAREGGRVWLRATREQDKVVLTIGNTAFAKGKPGTQTGSTEVRARLRHCFGDRADVQTQLGKDIFELQIRLPTHNPQPCNTT